MNKNKRKRKGEGTMKLKKVFFGLVVFGLFVAFIICGSKWVVSKMPQGTSIVYCNEGQIQSEDGELLTFIVSNIKEDDQEKKISVDFDCEWNGKDNKMICLSLLQGGEYFDIPIELKPRKEFRQIVTLEEPFPGNYTVPAFIQVSTGLKDYRIEIRR